MAAAIFNLSVMLVLFGKFTARHQLDEACGVVILAAVTICLVVMDEEKKDGNHKM